MRVIKETVYAYNDWSTSCFREYDGCSCYDMDVCSCNNECSCDDYQEPCFCDNCDMCFRD